MPALTVTRLVVLIAAVGAALRLLSPAPLELLDLKTVDLRHTIRGPIPPGGEVVIVAIDEASLTAIGRWPWPRARLAELVDRMVSGGVVAIGFDLVFDQPERQLDLPSLKAAVERAPRRPAGELLAEVEASLDGDRRLADSMQTAGRVVLGHFFEFGGEANDAAGSFPELSVRETAGADATFLPAARRLHGNVPSLATAAWSVGHLNFLPDPDGEYRRLPLGIRLGDRIGPAFALELLRRAGGGAAATLTLAPFGVAAARLGPLLLPVDERGELWVNYLGPAGAFPRVSAADVLAGRVPPDTFTGRLAILGATAAGFDSLATPFGPVVPGAEVHATVIDNVLHGRSLRRPAWLPSAEAAGIVVGGVLIGVGLRRLRGVLGVAFALGLGLLYAAASQWAFVASGLVLSAVYPLATMVACALGGAVFQYVSEEAEKRRIRGAFRTYVGPEVTELLAADPTRLRLGGERRPVTVFFSDIRGFTTLSEGLAPEALGELLNDYLGAMTDIVFRHRGLLDKYIGDAIMAFWGAPVDAPDQAAQACRAALDMLAALPGMHARWRERGWPTFAIGIGVDTGEVVVGNFGSAQRFSYTAMGDHVNLASRLEGLNKQYGTTVLLSGATRAALGDDFVCREVDRVRVKGKTVPVAIFELLGRTANDGDGRWRRLEDLFARALSAYRARAWDDAERALQQVATEYPGDGPARVYLERCAALRSAPPPEGWDGVFESKTK